jgi:hypothetical protein
MSVALNHCFWKRSGCSGDVEPFVHYPPPDTAGVREFRGVNAGADSAARQRRLRVTAAQVSRAAEDVDASTHWALLSTFSADVQDLHHVGEKPPVARRRPPGLVGRDIRFLRHSGCRPETSALFPLARAAIEGAAIAHNHHDPRSHPEATTAPHSTDPRVVRTRAGSHS